MSANSLGDVVPNVFTQHDNGVCLKPIHRLHKLHNLNVSLALHIGPKDALLTENRTCASVVSHEKSEFHENSPNIGSMLAVRCCVQVVMNTNLFKLGLCSRYSNSAND